MHLISISILVYIMLSCSSLHVQIWPFELSGMKFVVTLTHSIDPCMQDMFMIPFV